VGAAAPRGQHATEGADHGLQVQALWRELRRGLAGLSAQARGVVGEWGADEIDVDLEEEAEEGGGDCNTFDLASSVLEELGEGGDGEDE
jgi:hypothetical protein